MSQPQGQSLLETPSPAPSYIRVSSPALNSSASPTETTSDGSSFHSFIVLGKKENFKQSVRGAQGTSVHRVQFDVTVFFNSN